MMQNVVYEIHKLSCYVVWHIVVCVYVPVRVMTVRCGNEQNCRKFSVFGGLAIEAFFYKRRKVHLVCFSY